MSRPRISFVAFFSLSMMAYLTVSHAALRGDESDAVPAYNSDSSNMEASSDQATHVEEAGSAESDEIIKAREAMKTVETPSEKPKKSKKVGRAEAFIAGADWEFDGFIAGGQDQQVKSMFATNDLVYLNVGSEQGIVSGERLGVYRRGERIKDPQSGRVLGFEVRKLAIIEVTSRLDAQTCSARVIQAYEAAEIGDLVRKE